jgi:hypothetical protein
VTLCLIPFSRHLDLVQRETWVTPWTGLYPSSPSLQGEGLTTHALLPNPLSEFLGERAGVRGGFLNRQNTFDGLYAAIENSPSTSRPSSGSRWEKESSDFSSGKRAT